MHKDDVFEFDETATGTSTKEIVDFCTDVISGAAFGAVRSVTHTALDLAKGVGKLSCGDFDSAMDITSDRIEKMVQGTSGLLESGICVAEAVSDSLLTGKPFITEDNKANLTNLCTAGLFVAVGTAGMPGEITHSDVSPDTDVTNLPGVENGVFTGDADDLEQLIKAGELEDTTHISDPERDEAVRAEFLQMNGITDTNGWEVHHVVPLSEGGADDPSNMVLIDPESHDQITKEHAEFYDWLNKA